MTERYADGDASYEDWDSVRRFVHGAFHHTDAHFHATHGIDSATCCSHNDDRLRDIQTAAEYVILANVIRDIFGNPFCPVLLNSSWLTSSVFTLAQQMYETRDFTLVPVLADALQDAGCDNEDVLNHCRATGPHVRGCYVIDLVLQKA
jgi:hypothetical protein